jgi:protein-L-isoaspartate(D-aspartate) O-methyltransferase
VNAAVEREERAHDALIDAVAAFVRDRRVLRAMRRVPRHRFVPLDLRAEAYDDVALPIGEGQTISQPVVVGIMTEALALRGGEHVLEVGTGSGYQAAILAELAGDVVTVEVIDALRERAARTLGDLGVRNVRVLAAGDEVGAPEYGPYDAIAVTAAMPEVPQALLDQLRTGGRLVAPVGSLGAQRLVAITRLASGFEERSLGACRFVPLVGPAGFRPWRRRAASAASATRPALADLRAALASADPRAVATAAHELAAAGVCLAFDGLAPVRAAIASAHDPGRRAALVRDYLCLLGPAEAPGAIAELLRGEEPYAREAAFESAVALGAPAVPTLSALAADRDRDTRWFAVEALRQIDGARAIPALIERLEDDDFAIRWAASQGLVHAGEAAFEPVLHALVARPASLTFHQAARRVIEHVAPPGADGEGGVSALLDALAHGTTVFDSGGRAFALLRQLRGER